MWRIAGKNDDAAGWIRGNLVAVEPIAATDVEHARHHGVDPVLRMLVRHEFAPERYLNADNVRTGVGRMPHEYCEKNAGWKSVERSPYNFVRQDRLEVGLVWLMFS
jgi:hypothetical protein